MANDSAVTTSKPIYSLRRLISLLLGSVADTSFGQTAKMSVIIRLQNLAWSANALDIRQFFRGLSIPEGGVHIVGGELGDAFIAFR